MFAIYVDHMGNDDSVVNAARISMDKEATQYSDKQNASLINYLATGMQSSDRNDLVYKVTNSKSDKLSAELINYIKNIPPHWTPFAHTAITLRMSAPVPIRTQCFKQKTGMVENEESRRYISSKPEIHIPEYFREVGANVKQGSAGKHPNDDYWMENYLSQCQSAVSSYMSMIEDGVCPEQARFVLPQGTLVNWIWTGNLYSFANFYMKRSDSHAQQEIRELAELVKQQVQPLFPVSWAALCGE